ncbi:MAG TPA: type II toxin-antitoxin system HicB family antitoxin [Thermomicrobiales bacterium]|nr:type II toxin-antitoxin system HicB family antitoxin [Thermomicrobiales bacterium]
MDEQTPRYAIVIEWDPEDRIYVATVPDLRFVATHGDTYQEALERVLELVAEWLDLARESGVAPPEPRPLGQAASVGR